MTLSFLRGIILICTMGSSLFANAQVYTQALNGNPIIPGYFADPTVKKFGDTYYIYATTDGNGGGFGPSQVWVSKDFVNWSLQDMNWPTTHYYWAPDVTKGNDGKYYMYYCQPVVIFGAAAATPVGPWTSLLPDGVPIVKNFLVPNVITLDGQTFRDDDGKFYMYWGTWGIYPNHGCGVGLMNPDMKSFGKLAQIPNTVAKDFFEAPFMFKRNGIYYLTYSSGRCEDESYRVQYVMSKTGPMGPFVYGKNNPILVTNAEGTVHGPGHQSVLQEGNDFYLIYHRHNNPHSGGGFHRQIAADKMEFDENGNILTIKPTHKGIGYLSRNVNPDANLAFGKAVKASSSYSDDFKAEFAVDDNNGTLWKAKDNVSPGWLEIDLGVIQNIRNVHTQFEYATWSYQYMIEYSSDRNVWLPFADRRNNTVHGSPMVDIGDVKGRYLRIMISGTEYPGLNKGIWNIKVFENDIYQPAMAGAARPANFESKPKGLLVDFEAGALKRGQAVLEWVNKGKLAGSFVSGGKDAPVIELTGGKQALVFSGNSFLKSSFSAPSTLIGNSSFSVAMWVYNPEIEDEEPVVSWAERGGVDLTNATIGYGSNKKWGVAAHWGWADMGYKSLPEAGKWHHIAIVFDGTLEKLYVNGQLEKTESKMLFVDKLSAIFLGTTPEQHAYFSGALASLKLYDIPLTATEIKVLSEKRINSHIPVYFDAADMDYGAISDWKNEGYALGRLAANAGMPVVKDVGGRLALNFKGNINLALKDADPGFKWPPVYALVAYIFDHKINQWQHLVYSFDGRTYSIYVNGVLVDNKATIAVSISENLVSIKLPEGTGKSKATAISGLQIYDYAYDLPAVAADYQQWGSTLQQQVMTASFAVKPLAVSAEMVSMQASPIALPGGNIRYLFTGADMQGNILESGWQSSCDFNGFGLVKNTEYTYVVRARDYYGNVSLPSAPLRVKTDTALFQLFKPDFNLARDVLKQGMVNASWDGLKGTAEAVNSIDGILTLKSANTKWDGSSPTGPFIYKRISGDFIMQVEIADVSGLSGKKTNGANDAGLMVHAGDGSNNLLQNSIFPGWGVGNLVTNLTSRGRFQTNNASSWNFYRHLQIQRAGNIFHLRGSIDGKQWMALPGSPVIRNDMDKKPVDAGLFQATYGEQSGYGAFKRFEIIQRK